MAWVRLDDHFPDHAKLAHLGDRAPLAGWLYVCALAFANRQLTDGRIPKSHIHKLVNFRHIHVVTGTIGKGRDALKDFTAEVDVDELAEGLVAVGLWEDRGDAYLIHDYGEYQPSRDEVIRQREGARARMDRWRAKGQNGVGNGVTNGVTNAVTNAVTDGVTDASVTLTPDPDPLSTRTYPPTPLKGDGPKPTPGPGVGVYWQVWREVAESHGMRPYLTPRGAEVAHLATAASHCTPKAWADALEAWWTSPHVTGRNLGLAVSQLPELLAYVAGDRHEPFRAPRGVPKRSQSPPIRAVDPGWRAACPHTPPCTHPARCQQLAAIAAIKAGAAP